MAAVKILIVVVVALSVAACGSDAADGRDVADAADTVLQEVSDVSLDAMSDTSEAPQDPLVPLSHTTPNWEGQLSSVAAYDSWVFVCGMGGAAAFDVADPAAPRFVQKVSDGVACVRIEIEPPYLYVLDRELGVQGFTPSASTIEPLGSPYRNESLCYFGLTRKDDRLYLATHQEGVEVLAIADNDELSHDTFLQGAESPWDLASAGGSLLVADGQAGMSVLDPESGGRMANLPLSGSATRVFASGEHAYLALGSGGVAIVDISSPQSPNLLAAIDTPGVATGASHCMGGGPMFIADTNLLRFYDLSDPTTPVSQGTEAVWPENSDELGRVVDVSCSGDLVAVAEWGGLHLFASYPQVTAPDIEPMTRIVTFPPVNVGETEYAAVVLHNRGQQPLNITDIRVADPQFVTDKTALSVAPHESDYFEVSFTPTGDEMVESEMTVVSNDPDEAELKLALTAGRPYLEPGQTAPDFVLSDLDGSTVTLSEQKAKTVMLFFFGST